VSGENTSISSSIENALSDSSVKVGENNLEENKSNELPL